MLQTIKQSLINPILSMRLRYLPLLMIYFSYGALGLTAIAEDFWVKESLSLSAVDLASLTIWLTLPWTIKMVFGQLVDSVTIFKSKRRIYVFIGAGMIACGMIIMAGSAGGWVKIFPLNVQYVIAQFIIAIGVVLQDVVADAMSTEVVERKNFDGSDRDKKDIYHDLAMVQVLGRLFLSFGAVIVAGLAGWLAQIYSYETVFLTGLIIPFISVIGVCLVKLHKVESSKINWKILSVGIAFGILVAILGVSQVAFCQEIIFVISMIVVCSLLFIITKDIKHDIRVKILFAAIIIFAFRAVPTAGVGQQWWMIDILGFDKAFFGTLSQIGAVLSIAGMWMFSDYMSRHSIGTVLSFLVIIGTILYLPILGMYYGLHEWTESLFGFGARSIALIDTTVSSPFDQLSMIPMLTLIAIYAPNGKRATWFALMASLMNLALVARRLQTKYLNEIFVIQRGNYDELGNIMIITSVVGLIVPLLVIFLCGRKV